MDDTHGVVDLCDSVDSDDDDVKNEKPCRTWTTEQETCFACIPSFQCPITLDAFQNPVVASDGHTYTGAALDNLFSSNPSAPSPLNRQPIANDAVYINYALLGAMNEFAQFYEETMRKSKESDKKQQKMKASVKCWKTMYKAATDKINKLEKDMADMNEKNNMERENLMTKVERENGAYNKAVLENAKIVKEKRALDNELTDTKDNLKRNRDTMDAIMEMIHNNDHPKLNKKVKH